MRYKDLSDREKVEFFENAFFIDKNAEDFFKSGYCGEYDSSEDWANELGYEGDMDDFFPGLLMYIQRDNGKILGFSWGE